MTIQGDALVDGSAAGPVLVMVEPLSLWGGVDPYTGAIIDGHHPQAGQIVTGAVVIMSEARGSSSAATVLAEMIRLGTAPAAMVLGCRDPILVAGAVVADELYAIVMPVVYVPGIVPAELTSWSRAEVHGSRVVLGQA